MALIRPTAAQINTLITTISDPLVVLNQGSTAANIDIGFVLNRGNAANVAIVWQESSNQFVLATTSSSGSTNANIAVSNYANLRAGNITVSASSGNTTTIVGNTAGNYTVTLPGVTGTLATLGNPGQQQFNGALLFNNSVTATNNLFLNSFTTGTISVGNSQTTGTITIGSASQTGDIVLGRSTLTQTVNIANGATASGNTSTINIGTAGAVGSNTNIVIGPTLGRGNVFFNNNTVVTMANSLSVTGNISATSVTIANLIGNPNVTVTGSLIPSANITYDLGSPTQRWREGWFSGSTIHIGSESISVDSNGKWTFTSDGAAVELGKNNDFNPPRANISGNVTATNYLFANGTPLMTVVNTMIGTANTNMKGYADGQISTTTSAITTANTNLKGYTDNLVTTANTNLKGYVDGTISNLINGAPGTLDTLNEIAVALGNDANLSVTLTSLISNVQSNVTTSNTNMKGYVDGQTSTTTTAITTANTNLKGYTDNLVTTANTNMKGYVDNINSTLTANAGAQANSISSLTTTKANLSGAVFTGAITTTELFVTSSGGDEGGQLNLAPAATNTTLAGNVVIDVFQNRLRIFEGGGTARGGYFDLSGLSAGVGTNLAAGGGGGTPGGTNSQIQFNNSSSFGGATSLYYFSGNGVVLANAAVASTSTTTGALQVSGGIGVAGNVWCGQVYSTNNGNGTNYRIGDDAWLGDVNTADTTQLMGAQNGNNGYLRFGNVGTETLGRAGSGALTWTGTFSATNINSDNHNYANGVSIITTLSTAFTTANTNLKGYTDGQITTVNSSITTANTNLKGYTDNLVTTANTNMKGYVDGQISTTTSAITTANTNIKGYVDAINTTLTSNAATQNGQIITANTNMKGYVDGQITSLVNGAPSTLDTLNELAAALGNDANLSASLTSMIGNVQANVTTANTNMKGYVDSVANLSSYSDANVTSYLPTHSGNVGASSVNATNLYGTIRTAAQTSITSVGTLTSLAVSGVITANSGSATAPAITTTGDTNTGIFFPAADTIAFTEGGVEAMRISSVGAVGIGVTPSPWSGGGVYALQIGSRAAFCTDQTSTVVANNVYLAAAGGGYLTLATGNSSIYSQSDGSHAWWTSPSVSSGSAPSLDAKMTLSNAGVLTVNGSAIVSANIRVNSLDRPTAIANGGTNGVGNIGASGAGFNTVFAKSTSAQYADLAEVYRSDRNYIPGTVVVFGGTSEVTVSLTSHDTKVAGVVSTNPAYLMNDREEGVAVALQGRVPCRVLGPVVKGDRVVTSDVRGVAERLDMTKYQPGCIIGKTLDSVPDGEIATIEVVVGRN